MKKRKKKKKVIFNEFCFKNFYKLINKCQTSKKNEDISFDVYDLTQISTIENILKDLDLIIDKKVYTQYVSFTIKAKPKKSYTENLFTW